MPARTFERGIEDIEKTERSNVSTQGLGAVPYGMSDPAFNFMGQAPGQSIPGAYGQMGQPFLNPFGQQQFQPWGMFGSTFGQQPWSMYGQTASQGQWPVYGQQQFMPHTPQQYGQSYALPFGQTAYPHFAQPPFGAQLPFSQFGAFGQPGVSGNPFVNPYAQIALHSQLAQQPVPPFTQPSFFPFAQSAIHPLAQQQFNPIAQQLPITPAGVQQQYNPFVQQAINPIAQQFANPFSSLGFFAGSGQSQQTLPFTSALSQQIPGVFGQQPSGIPGNPLLSTLGTLQSPFSQITNPLSQFGQQIPWSQIAPYQYSQFARFAQSQMPERYGFGQSAEYGRTGSQSQSLVRAPKGYKRSDDRIKDDIIERLISYPQIDASDMEIVVKDGEVTLRGSVEDRNIKRISEEMSESVFGVRDVLNELRINPRFMPPGSKEREQELAGAGTSRGKEK